MGEIEGEPERVARLGRPAGAAQRRSGSGMCMCAFELCLFDEHERLVRTTRCTAVGAPLYYRESGHRLLMEALAAAGNVAEALRVYDDLGITPAADIVELHGRLVGDEGVRDRVPLPASLARRSAFIGRAAELAVLRDAWTAARSRRRRFVLLSGPPGIGKTRLTAELAQSAEGTVLYGNRPQEPLLSYGARTSSPIGRARGARGRIRFTPAEGRRGRREIVALIERGGVVTQSLTVGRYAAPGPRRPARPRGLVVSRRGETLTVRWKGSAPSFAVTVHPRGAPAILRVTRSHRVRIRGVTRRRGTVLVGGLSVGSRTGPQARATWGSRGR